MEKLIHFVINHWALWLALVVIIVLLTLEEFRDKIQGIKRISAAELTKLLNRDQVVVVDVRDKASFDKGHIIGAINIPTGEIEANLKKLEKYKDKEVVIVDATGQSTMAPIGKFRKDGFKFCCLKNGMNGWRAANLPVVKK